MCLKRFKSFICCVCLNMLYQMEFIFQYALSENCQMEFRFAHVALKKPIILAVVGTGFLWESTEVRLDFMYYKLPQNNS